MNEKKLVKKSKENSSYLKEINFLIKRIHHISPEKMSENDPQKDIKL